MPIPRPAGPVLRHIDIVTELQHHRPRHIRAQPGNAHVAIARIHLRLRMFVTIPVSDLENRQIGMDGVQERRCRGGSAAVMGRQQHVGGQFPLRRTGQQLRFLRRFNVAGQQDRVRASRDFHGAAAGVRLQCNVRVTGGQWMQHGEVHSFFTTANGQGMDTAVFPLDTSGLAHLGMSMAIGQKYLNYLGICPWLETALLHKCPRRA